MDRAKEERLANSLKDPKKDNSSIPKLIDDTIRHGNKIYLMTDWHLWVRNKKNHPECHKCKSFNQIFENINNTLKPDDLLIYLGDLVDGEFENKEELKAALKNITFKKILVRGNNDLFPLQFYKSCGFEDVVDSFVWHDIIFSHIPLKNKNEMNIHGHLHGYGIYWIPYRNHIDVASLKGRIKPVELKDVIKHISKYKKTIKEDPSHFDEGYTMSVSGNIFEECMNSCTHVDDPF